MAGQSIFFRTLSLINNNLRITPTNRVHNSSIAPVFLRLKHGVAEGQNVKIPEKPKRPMSSYLIYMQENRAKYIEANPSVSMVDVTKKLSEQWKSLNPEAKRKYDKEAKVQRTEYEKQLSEYKSKLTPQIKDILEEIKKESDEDRVRRKLKKEKLEENRPKKPATPYLMFSSEVVKKEGIKSIGTDIVKKKWDVLPEEIKEKYNKEYLKKKEEYMKALEEWEKSMMEKGKIHLVRSQTLHKHNPSKRTTNKTSKTLNEE